MYNQPWPLPDDCCSRSRIAFRQSASAQACMPLSLHVGYLSSADTHFLYISLQITSLRLHVLRSRLVTPTLDHLSRQLTVSESSHSSSVVSSVDLTCPDDWRMAFFSSNAVYSEARPETRSWLGTCMASTSLTRPHYYHQGLT